MRRFLVFGLALVLVAGLLVAGVVVWQRHNRTPLEEALHAVPAGSLRVGFTDWSAVRREAKADLGKDPSAEKIEAFVARAYDRDFNAASSIDSAAAGMQEKFGFGPVNSQWEAYAQGRKGATLVLKVADGTDFDVLADNLETDGYTRPKEDDGVWNGGADLVANLDPTFTPEVQYISLLEDQGLVVTSDDPEYAATAADVASGDGDSVASKEGVGDVAEQLGDPANAMLWTGDFACDDLSMSSADQSDQDQAKRLVSEAGGVTPVNGLAMAMMPNRTLRVVLHFEDSDRAQKNLRPRAKLAVGDAPGRGVSFADDFKLTASSSKGSEVVLDLRPRQSTGYVLSSLYDGPVLFATC
ncbi:MAG: hypothetical protein ABWY19_01780 [Marmoricola sp.]